VSSRRTDAPNALWLFRDADLGAPEPVAAPVRPPPREPRPNRNTKGQRKPRNARPSRDLFTAVGSAFARSSEAARSEHDPAPPEAEAPPAPPRPVPKDSPADAPRTGRDDRYVRDDRVAHGTPVPSSSPADRPVHDVRDDRPPSAPTGSSSFADALHPVLSDSRFDPSTPAATDVLPDLRALADPPPLPARGELEIGLIPGAGARQSVLALLREADDVATAPLDAPRDRRLDHATTPLQHVSILASAGSGKTYQLTNRYLQILSRGAAPHAILASTFTRAAAGEIRDRILRTLAESADADDKRHELTRRLQRGELPRQFVLDLLTALAHNLHRLQIRTLDSFFGTIVRCFTLELGLPNDARIVDEDEAFRLRRSAIQRMLEEGDEANIIEMLASLTEGSSERAVTDTIDNTVSALYDLFREARFTDAWNAIPAAETLTEAQVDQAIEALRAAAPSGPKRTIDAHARDCERAVACRTGSSDDWMEFFAGGLAAKVADGTCVYYAKPIDGHTIAAYNHLLRHAKGVYRRRVIDQTRATHRLLELFDDCYQRVKRQHKVLTFSDLTAALAQADLEGRLDDICYRLDARLRHILLDEMQDTSIQQWNALRPIVDETVSYTPEERSFFCVGDVKQSIYGWRNACPEILSHIDQLLGAGAGIIKQNLATSYRSSPAVIDVVNRIFTDLVNNPTLQRYPDAARRWDDEFVEHTTSRTNLPGYVRLRTVARCEDQARRTNLRLQEAAALVDELYRRHPGKTIGVLLRTNGAVGRLLYELGPTRLKVPATGRGGGPLTDAPAVNALLDLLRMAEHPDHSVAAFNVLTSPLGPIVDLRDESPGARHRVAARFRRQIASDGLARTLQPIIKAIAGQVDERQYRRCMQLIQLAQQWDERASLRIDDFVALVETRAVADPAASTVQIMTIHQAKGLEFDIVILPELEAELASTRTLKVVYEREGEAGPIARIARHVSKDMWSMFDDLRPMFEQHIGRLAHESLCLLYVAVTRAREGLFMLIDPPPEGSRTPPARMSSLVLHALTAGRSANAPPIEPDQVVFEWGDRSWLDPHEPVAPAPADPSAPHLETPQEPVTPLTFAPTEGPLLRSSGALASDLTGRTVGDLLALSDGPVGAWGAAIRALFAEVEWLDDWRPERARLVAAAQAAVVSRDEEWAIARVGEFERMLEAPAVRRALSRGGVGADRLQVERQVPFARLDSGALQTGEIPRVVLELTDGTGTGEHVQRATVLGFCLDAVDSLERASERAAAYREPMLAWRSATAEQWGLARTDVAGVLVFVGAGLVVPMS
jgi:ATP-dependent helicase/nuclease subunit A